MSREARTYWWRALALWIILMLAETLHGLWRVKVLAIWIGDAAAREVSVFTGSLVILLITFAFIGWISARSAPTLLIVGTTWVALTVVYEFILGRVVFHQTWADILSDFDLLQGRLLPIGLLFLLFAPLLAARLRGRIGPQAIHPRV